MNLYNKIKILDDLSIISNEESVINMKNLLKESLVNEANRLNNEIK